MKQYKGTGAGAGAGQVHEAYPYLDEHSLEPQGDNREGTVLLQMRGRELEQEGQVEPQVCISQAELEGSSGEGEDGDEGRGAKYAAQGDAEEQAEFNVLRGVKRGRELRTNTGQKRDRKCDEAAVDAEAAELEWRGATKLDCKRRSAENRIS